MIVTINDRDVYALALRCPRTGAWHGTRCEVAGEEPIPEGSRVTVVIDGEEWVGTVTDSHPHGETTVLTLVGGAGGLSKTVQAQHYLTPTPGLVIRAILGAVGETLDESSIIPETKLPHWLTAEGKASHALTAICDKAGLVWRVLRNGKVWVGTELWPEVAPDVEDLDEDWTDGSIIVAGESFAELQQIAPGTVYGGHRLEQVEHRFDQHRARTYPQISSLEGAATEFLAAVRRETERALTYPCEVVAQNADGTLQLKPEDPRLPAKGLDGVPIRYGSPGWEAKVQKGARVRLAFDNGDRSQPYVALWDTSEGAVTSLEFKPGGASAPVVRVGDIVELALPMNLPFTSTVGAGVITVTTPLRAMIVGPGNAKLLA